MKLNYKGLKFTKRVDAKAAKPATIRMATELTGINPRTLEAMGYELRADGINVREAYTFLQEWTATVPPPPTPNPDADPIYCSCDDEDHHHGELCDERAENEGDLCNWCNEGHD